MRHRKSPNHLDSMTRVRRRSSSALTAGEGADTAADEHSMVGVDWLHVRFKVTEEQVAIRDVDGMKVFHDRGGMRVIADIRLDRDTSIHAKLDLGKETLTVQFNPSRQVSTTGGLCPFSRVAEARDLMLAEVDRQLGVFVLTRHRDAAELLRVDVADDFLVHDAPRVIEQLIPHKRAYSSRLDQYRDPNRFHTTGLVVGGKQSHAKLYLRPESHPHHPEKDWVRFEVTARDNWMQRLLPRGSAERRIVFSDLTQENCQRLLHDRWLWSRFGSPHSGGSDWWGRVQRELSTSELRAFCAYLFALQHDRDLGYQRDMVKAYARLLDRFGPPPGHTRQEDAEAPTQRLHLGRVFPRVLPVPRSRA